VDGSVRHAVRRVDEMDAAAELLRELGVIPRVAESAAEILRDLARSPRLSDALRSPSEERPR
jgi:hypothetical protein